MGKLLMITSFVQGFHNYRDGVDRQLMEIFGDRFEAIDALQVCDEPTSELMHRYAGVLIFCPDTWSMKGTDPLAVELTRYVITGGKLMHLHVACFGSYAEGAQLLAGAFRMHPPYQQYTFRPTPEGMSWMDGVDHFTIPDEAHLMHTERLLEKEILLYTTDQDGKIYEEGAPAHQDIYAQSSGFRIPMAWRLRYGKGKIVYVCPGHNAESFENKTLQSFLRNAMEWLDGEPF